MCLALGVAPGAFSNGDLRLEGANGNVRIIAQESWVHVTLPRRTVES